MDPGIFVGESSLPTPISFDAVQAIKALLRDGEYVRASEQARTLRGRALVEALAVSSVGATMRGVREAVAESSSDLEEARRAIRDSKKGRELAASYVKTLLEREDGPIEDEKTAARVLALLLSKKLSRMRDDITAMMTVKDGSDVSPWSIDAGTFGFHAGVLSDFQRLSKQSVESLRTVFESIEAETARIRRANDERVTAIHAAVASSRPDHLRAACVGALGALETEQVRISNLAALVSLARHDAASRNGPSSEWRWAELGLEVAGVVRSATWTYALGLYGIGLAGSAAKPRIWDRHVRAARELRFASVVPDGVDVGLATLARDPAEHDDRFVETSGFVEDLETFKENGDKTSSAFTLVDRARDARFRVVLPFRSVHRTGIANGCAARVNGTVYRSDSDGQWRLRLDTLNYSTYRDESWTDRMADTLRNQFALWPQGHNLIYTFEPRGDAERGAGEYELFRIRPTARAKRKSA